MNNKKFSSVSGAPPRVRCIIAASGVGSRVGLGYNKLLARVGSKTILEHTLDIFRAYPVTLVVSALDMAEMTLLTQGRKNVSTVLGGETRFLSVKNALATLPDCDIVVIHDGARPDVPGDTVQKTIADAVRYGSGIACAQIFDTLRRRTEETFSDVDRSGMYSVKTPQSFDLGRIKEAYGQAGGDAASTDDAAIYRAIFGEAHYTPCPEENRKITTAEDILHFEALVQARASRIPVVGNGYDVHAFCPDRRLILGGIQIPCEMGLAGHSDADALTHAVMDAMLGCIGGGDIGRLFPDTDGAYKDIDSLILLKRVKALLDGAGAKLTNLSCIIHAQQPKLAPFVPAMAARLGEALSLPPSRVGISATTWEKLGHIGRSEGIACSCVCMATLPNFD